MTQPFAYPPPASGALTQLQKIVSPAGAVFDFNPVSGGYIDAKLIIDGISDNGGQQASVVSLTVNGDTGANYDLSAAQVQSSAGYIMLEQSAQNNLFLGSVSTKQAPSQFQIGHIEIDFYSYASALLNKVFYYKSYARQSAPKFTWQHGYGFWLNSSIVPPTPITRITVTLATGNWAAGSVGILYGRGN